MDDILTLRMTRKVFEEIKRLLNNRWLSNELIEGDEFKFDLRELEDHQVNIWVTVRSSQTKTFLVEMKELKYDEED